MIYPNPEEGKSALVSNCGCIEVDYWNCQGLFCGCVSIFTSLFTVEGLVCVSLHLHTAALIIVFFQFVLNILDVLLVPYSLVSDD